jgi:uncharacterized surface anchored protein
VLVVKDNDANDADSAAGKIKVQNIPCGKYDIAETGVPTGYVALTGAQTVTITSTGTTPVTVTFVNKCVGDIIIHKVDTASPTPNFIGGATFTITDNTTGATVLVVKDNDANDADSAAGKIKVQNIPCGKYDIAETGVPTGYVALTGAQTVTITSTGTTPVTVTFVNKCVGDIIIHKYTDCECIGLTPGYWKNWDNHYTREQFEILLQGTIANGDIEIAQSIFGAYSASSEEEMTILKAHLLATQLTLNLTNNPDMPNPDDSNLT